MKQKADKIIVLSEYNAEIITNKVKELFEQEYELLKPPSYTLNKLNGKMICSLKFKKISSLPQK